MRLKTSSTLIVTAKQKKLVHFTLTNGKCNATTICDLLIIICWSNSSGMKLQTSYN